LEKLVLDPKKPGLLYLLGLEILEFYYSEEEIIRFVVQTLKELSFVSKIIVSCRKKWKIFIFRTNIFEFPLKYHFWRSNVYNKKTSNCSDNSWKGDIFQRQKPKRSKNQVNRQ